MKAKLVNEDLSNILKPKSIEEIAKNMELDLKDPNFINLLLVKAVKNDQAQIIQYALDNGANQLWWQSGGPMGGHHGIQARGITDDLVRIIGLKGAGHSSSQGFYDKTNFSIVMQVVAAKVWQSMNDKFNPYHSIMKWKIIKNGGTGGSQLFYRKYSPVDENFLNEIEEMKKGADEFLKIVKKLQG